MPSPSPPRASSSSRLHPRSLPFAEADRAAQAHPAIAPPALPAVAPNPTRSWCSPGWVVHLDGHCPWRSPGQCPIFANIARHDVWARQSKCVKALWWQPHNRHGDGDGHGYVSGYGDGDGYGAGTWAGGGVGGGSNTVSLEIEFQLLQKTIRDLMGAPNK